MKKILAVMENPNIEIKESLKEMMSPSKVFLTIDSSALMKITSKTVSKGELLYINHEKKVYCPISGYIKNIVKRKNYLGEETSYMQIQNNYQELSNYKGVDSTTTIISPNLKSQILSYTHLDLLKFKNQEVLYVSGLEEEPFLENKNILHEACASEILLMMDLLCDALNISSSVLILKETDSKSILSFEKYKTTYPNIKVFFVPDEYPLKMNLKKYLPLKENTPLIETNKIYDLYYEIVKGRQKDFLIFTLAGNALKKSLVLKVKIGTYLKEIMDTLNLVKEKEYNVYINSLMRGVKASLEDIYLTEDILGVFVMKKEDMKEQICQNCGKCNEVCPLKNNVYECVKTNGRKKLKTCLSCGLCSFVCPSHINMTNYIKGKELEHENTSSLQK